MKLLPAASAILYLLLGSVVALALSIPKAAYGEASSSSLVYHEKGRFAGFPANEGAWSWGNEILVGFMVTDHLATESGHNQVDNAPRRIRFARSLDGGQTWAVEQHENLSLTSHARDPERYRDIAPALRRPRPLENPIDFSNPDLAIKIRDEQFYVSTNRGRQWDGPFLFPNIVPKGKLDSRTSYRVTGPASCQFFLSADVSAKGAAERSRSFVAETTDGGLTMRFVGWMGDDISKGVDAKRVTYSTMPSVVRLADGTLLGTLRRRIGSKDRWTDIVSSSDEGRTWKKLTTLERDANNPMALVTLGGSRAAAIYGDRAEDRPTGIVAQITSDAGRTWSAPVPIRGDAAGWDMGYCRAVTLPDGRIAVLYYFTEKGREEQHIACTLWSPPADQ